MSDLDGRHLDRLETELRQAIGRDNAITSGELADRITDEDSEANPKTREAIKVLMRERGLPVIGGNAGYFIPEGPQRVEDALETLDSRIDGIQERKQLLSENWENWERQHEMYTDGGDGRDAGDQDGSDDVDADIPDDVREQIEDDPVLTVEDWLEHRSGGSADA
jgi:hypothetical protein